MSLRTGKMMVGLTGGIASGKSSALTKFNELGWSVMSADFLAGDILASDKRVQGEITNRWGKDLLKSCGSIDKAAIARIVFAEELERRWLEELLHPIIRSKWISFVQSCPSSKCMVELPLLFENNLQNHFTCTLSAFAPIPTIMTRLKARGLSINESTARVDSQLSIFQKVSQADYVLWGAGSLKFLNHQVEGLDRILSK